MKNDIVTITCYGQTAKYKRQNAIKEFRTAMFCSEGHEQARYVHIYECLLCGDKIISDEEV